MVAMNKALLHELMQLSPAERIELAHELWDSVPTNYEALPPVTEAQLTEAKRRLAEHRQDPSTAVPWEEVRARLWSRLK
jgi:putative addiction module component (TIGR02574 family)